MRTPVEQAVERTGQIEDADRPPGNGEHFVGAGWDLCNGGNNVSLHDPRSISRPHTEPPSRGPRSDRIFLPRGGASYATRGQADNLLHNASRLRGVGLRTLLFRAGQISIEGKGVAVQVIEGEFARTPRGILNSVGSALD